MGGRALGRVRAGGGWACARKASAGSQTHPRGTRREAGCAPGMAGHASGGRLLGARRTGGWALARRAPGSRARFEGWVCAGESDAPPSGGGTLWEAECASGSRVRAGVCRGWLGMRPEGVCGESDALGGIWVVRANWAGGEADCPPARPRAQRTRVPLGRPSRPPVALARPQRPRAQRARVPPGCPPACPGLAEPPARSTRAPACPARPRTAGLPTPCPRPAIRAFSRPPCKFGRFCTHRPPFASASRLIVSPLPTPIRENDDPPWASVCLLAASRVQNRPNLQKRRLFPRIGPPSAFCAQPPTGASRPRISWQPASLVYRVVGRRPAGPSAGARFFSAAGRLAWRRHARSPILIEFETPRGRAPRARPLAENARDLG